MRKGLLFSILFVLSTALFCFFSSDYDVKAWTVDVAYTGDENGTYTAMQSVSSNSVMNDSSIPSSVVTDGIAVSFGIKHHQSDGDAYGYWTFYIDSPTSYAGQNIVYDGTPYLIKYPCGFINCYPSNVTIPSNYTLINDNNAPRSVRYANPAQGNLGTLMGGFICPSESGKDVLGIYEYRVTSVCNPLVTNSYSYKAYYYADGYSYGTYFTHPGDSNANFGVNDYWCMSNVPVPIFCDLYEALNYSVTGIIEYPERCLFGANTAVVTPTPTPTATPIPTGITGTVTVDGGTVNIGNFPTAEPTPTPIVPYYDGITTPTPRPSDAPDIELGKTGNAIVDNTIMPYLLPDDYTPGNYNFTPEIQDAIGASIGSSGSMINSAYLDDIKNGMGTVFTRLPLAVADDYLNPSRKQTYDDVSFASFFTGTLKAFSPNDDVAGGFDWDGIPRIYIAVIISSILVVIVKKIIH